MLIDDCSAVGSTAKAEQDRRRRKESEKESSSSKEKQDQEMRALHVLMYNICGHVRIILGVASDSILRFKGNGLSSLYSTLNLGREEE